MAVASAELADALAKLGHDLIRHALQCADVGELVELLATRLQAAGLPLLRLSVGSDLLHPTFEGQGWRWRPATGIVSEAYERQESWDREPWLNSTVYYMIEHQVATLHLPLDDAAIARFPMLAAFRDEGAVDYLAFGEQLGDGLRLGDSADVFVSFTRSGPERFDEPTVRLLRHLARAMILATYSILTVQASRTLLGIYLGEDAAQRVLAGNVVRGRTEPIEAVIWYSDLADFTKLTDERPPKSVLALLNDYASTITDELARHGGNVLKFIGDGVLAVFHASEAGKAASCALAAVDGVDRAVAELNEARRARGVPVTEPYVALHRGELLYGNFGSATRLDFTVLGPAVNQASRIAALSRSLDQRVIVSQPFADTLEPAARARLVSLGRFALRGVHRPETLYTLDPTA